MKREERNERREQNVTTQNYLLEDQSEFYESTSQKSFKDDTNFVHRVRLYRHRNIHSLLTSIEIYGLAVAHVIFKENNKLEMVFHEKHEQKII